MHCVVLKYCIIGVARRGDNPHTGVPRQIWRSVALLHPLGKGATNPTSGAAASAAAAASSAAAAVQLQCLQLQLHGHLRLLWHREWPGLRVRSRRGPGVLDCTPLQLLGEERGAAARCCCRLVACCLPCHLHLYSTINTDGWRVSEFPDAAAFQMV